MKDNQILAGMTELLAKPESWVKERIAGHRSEDGNIAPRYEGDIDANCFCLLGARFRVFDALGEGCRNEARQARSLIVSAIERLFPERGSNIAVFNDHPETTHADVLRVLEEARN